MLVFSWAATQVELIAEELPMKEFVARENIKRFEAQLAACTDPERRETLLQLLEAEREHLKGVRAERMSIPPPAHRS